MGRPGKRTGATFLLAVGLPVASAATLTVTSNPLGAGKGTPATCDAGVTVIPTLVSNEVSGATISGIASACGGGLAKLTVVTTAETEEATKAVPSGGGSVTVTLADGVVTKDVQFMAVTIQAP